MSKTVILVCAHKRDACLDKAPYLPVQVGRAIAAADLGFTGDDTGDNISAKNRRYCELTAHYWAWKNLRGYDYVGLNHYRRYFDFAGSSLCSLRTEPTARFFGREHPAPDCRKLFRRCDVVLGRPKAYPYNLYTDYCRCHLPEHLQTVRQVIAERHPDYLAAFDRQLFRNNRLSHFNMLLMPREEFDRYSAWLFDVLFEVERRIEIPTDPVQGRVMGYLSERLLGVYVRRNKLRVCYKTVIMVDDSKRKGVLKYLFHTAFNTAAFWLTYPFRRHRP